MVHTMKTVIFTLPSFFSPKQKAKATQLRLSFNTKPNQQTIHTNTMTGSSPNLPDLPITNLGNAEFTATKAAFTGENTVIGKLHGAPTQK